MSSYQNRNTSRSLNSNQPYDDSHIYVNIDIDSRTSSVSSENSTLGTANISKSIPIIMQAEHYHLIVDRFEINGRMLPLFIFNPNENYTVRITSGGINYDVNLIHVNNQGLTVSDIGYYYYYNYQDVIDIINTAFVTASGLAGVTAPFFTWDTDSQKFTIFADASTFNRTTGGTDYISFNIPIYRLFPAYSYDYIGAEFYRLRMFDNHNNIFTPSGTTPPYGVPPLPVAEMEFIFLKDQFSVVDKWNPVDSIIFVSNKISLKETFASISNVNQNNSNAGTLAILTDFKLDAVSSGDPRKTLIYNPSIYRLLDLYSSSPINTIDISVYFTDKLTNQLNPIRIFKGDRISIKLLFQKKELYE